MNKNHASVKTCVPCELSAIARALGGEVFGRNILCPGPQHSPGDRFLSVKFDLNASEGFVVHSFAGDHDERGIETAQTCAKTWHCAGREVFLVTPTALGLDFDDLLVGRLPPAEESAA